MIIQFNEKMSGDYQEKICEILNNKLGIKNFFVPKDNSIYFSSFANGAISDVLFAFLAINKSKVFLAHCYSSNSQGSLLKLDSGENWEEIYNRMMKYKCVVKVEEI